MNTSGDQSDKRQELGDSFGSVNISARESHESTSLYSLPSPKNWPFLPPLKNSSRVPRLYSGNQMTLGSAAGLDRSAHSRAQLLKGPHVSLDPLGRTWLTLVSVCFFESSFAVEFCVNTVVLQLTPP